MFKCAVISGPYFAVSSPNTGKHGPEIIPCLDTFHGVKDNFLSKKICLSSLKPFPKPKFPLRENVTFYGSGSNYTESSHMTHNGINLAAK